MTSEIADLSARCELEQLMGIEALSGVIDVPIKTIKDWRLKGEGPVTYKIGNHLRYAGQSPAGRWA